MLLAGMGASAQRVETTLNDGWRFLLGDASFFARPTTDDSKWQVVSVPHDWAITSAFSPDNDTPAGGKTGGLFFANTGWYRLHFDVPTFAEGRRVELRFDGAMSHPTVYVNGEKAGGWEYGYNAFTLDITPYVKAEGNVLAVRLYNEKGQSRWYPGAGLFRNVHLLVTDRAHIPTWGV